MLLAAIPHDVAQGQFPDVVAVLYNHGADMQACTSTGTNALHLAVGLGNAALLAMLVSLGCTDTRNRAGDTALDLARRMNRPDLADIIAPH